MNFKRIWTAQASTVLATLFLAGCGGGGGVPDTAAVTVTTYPVGGNVTGLVPGNSLVLQNNGTDNLTVNANGAFTFSKVIADASPYRVSILTSPPNQPCTSTFNAGTVKGANVNNVNLYCGPQPQNMFQRAAVTPSGPRSGHTATRLLNGKVLVASGFLCGFGCQAAAELYDPAANSWAAVGAPKFDTTGSTATLLPSGKVLLVGGLDNLARVNNDVELYDPVTNSLSSAPQPATPRGQHTAVLMGNGKVLVAGGFGAGKSAEIYDPVSNAWSRARDMGNDRNGPRSILLPNGKVLVTGGSGVVIPAELYDPITDTWSSAGVGDGVPVLLPNGKVLFVGLPSQLYDPETNSWSPAGAMAAPRIGPAVLLPTGKVLVVAGIDRVNCVLSTADAYDPVTNSWSPWGSLETPRAGHSVTLLADGRMLVVGGDCDAAWIKTPELGW